MPGPPSVSSDVDTLLAHQNVIANTHPEGSYFMTNEGHYVQLVNGVLTHVEFQPSPPPSIQYTPVQFMDQAGYNYHQTQSLPQQQQQQQQQHFQQQQVPIVQMQPQSLPQQQQHFEPPQMLDNYGRAAQLARPLMSSSPVTADPAASATSATDNTRMNMRMQRDVANAAGIKCSQF